MAVLACVGLGLGAGCGNSDDESRPGLPKATADALVQELDLAEERLRVTREERKVGACQDIENKSFPAIDALVAQVPDDTDPQVREALDESVARLRELTAAECDDLAREIEGEQTEPDPVPVPDETVPDATTEEETAPEEADDHSEKKPKKEKDNGNGGGAVPPGLDPTSPGQGGGAVPGAQDG